MTARALCVSPHLDDVAFSCGATAAALADAGWSVTLLTVFTRSVPQPRGFALACQLDKGLPADVDYMALRREEDRLAAAILAFANVVWLDLPEAPHRGYESAEALFGAFVGADTIATEVRLRLAEHVPGHDVVFAPQALGAHVDHRRVNDALRAVADPAHVAWYRDTPYAIRDPEATDAAIVRESVAFAARLRAESLVAKLDACAAYQSQIGFQFGGVAQMRATLSEFAEAEGVRHGIAGPAEVFAAGSTAGEALRPLLFETN